MNHQLAYLFIVASSLGLDRAHKAMFTELAVLYSKYKPEKLQEHLELFPDRINLPKIIRVCQTNAQWKELTYLYKLSKEPENAVMTMINHPVEAWDHNEFKSTVAKVSNPEAVYKVLSHSLLPFPPHHTHALHMINGCVSEY